MDSSIKNTEKFVVLSYDKIPFKMLKKSLVNLRNGIRVMLPVQKIKHVLFRRIISNKLLLYLLLIQKCQEGN